jgi:predicted TIM-barrel fold metal-dependent hydrolase
MSQQHVVISMDSHVELYVDSKAFLESRWHETFDHAVAVEKARFEHTRRWRPQLGNKLRMSGRKGEDHFYTDTRPLEQRLKELDDDGIAGEFITVGFGARSNNPEFMHALTLAEIRWFHEFFAPAAFRFRGAVVVTLPLGMNVVVEEIEIAHQHGIRAVILAGQPRNVGIHQPTLNSIYYDPMWRALAERDMAAVFHPGWSREKPLLEFEGTDYDPGWEGLTFMRLGSDTHDAMPQLLLGAVPQRHPNLRFGFIETGSTWIPPILAQLDRTVKGVGESSIKYEMLPSEMWHRQGFTSGPLEPADIDNRDRVGVENLAWGSDYPHSEGTWPISRQWLGYLFRDVPDQETQLMTAGNAVRIFGFDIAQLAETPAARQPWPTPEETAKWHQDAQDDHPFFKTLVKD